jgi:uncharacterized cupredoxin-like copper-binding protein
MFRNFRTLALSLAATALLALAPAVSQASTVVTVSLWDKGADMEMPTGLIYGVPGVDMSKATMGVKVSRDSAPAGGVTFKVTNDSKETVHEMLVFALAVPGAPLPYDAQTQRVDEETAGDKGEVSELEPGQSGSLTLNLKPGTYLLVCNIAGHYEAGMWTEFTVTP